MITLQIPEASPSANEHKWKHWSHHLKLRQHWLTLIWVAKVEARVPIRPPPDKVSVRVIREGRRLLDRDNGIAGLKSLLDALRDHQLILDDSDAHMTLSFEQRQIRKCDFPRTLIEITENTG